MEENGYVSYQSMIASVNTSVAGLERVYSSLGLDDSASALKDVRRRLQGHTFRVGIMGEFKRGKSTVINALLGQEIVPADILPCSATLNRIVWDAHPHAQINFKKEAGRDSIDVPVEELSNYVTKLTGESERQAESVEDAVVYYPCRFCQNGVEIVDTPGLNDDERMDRISESVIPTLDAIIMVLVPGSPFSITEADFVRNKILASDLGRLIFVVNKIDTVRPRDRERCVKGIRDKIEQTILEKMATLHGKDSNEYREAVSKLGGIRIYPISAADALDAKLEGDEELLKDSGMPSFEAELTRLLTEERGMLELMPVVSSAMSKLKEADSVITMRSNAMEMESGEFEKTQQDAMEKIQQSRREKQQKVAEIKATAKALNQELQPLVQEGYSYVQQKMDVFVDSYHMDAADLKDKAAMAALQDKLSNGTESVMKRAMQESVERMQVKIQERLNEQVDDLTSYSDHFTEQMQGIQGLIPTAKAMAPADTGKTAYVAEAVSNVIGFVGVGSALDGYKKHGLLGGVVGFGSGVLAYNASAVTCGLVIGLLGISMSAALVPAVLISGAAGTFAGKKLTDKVFDLFGSRQGVKQLASLRSQLHENIKASVQKMRTERVLENWLSDTTTQTFASLSEKLDHETEEVMTGLQETLMKIREDLTTEKAQKNETLRRLGDARRELEEIAQSLQPVKARLDQALNVQQAD